MCGICGIVVPPGARVDQKILRRMTRTMVHRGPDDEGYHIDQKGGCGLGHRRLSIIDLAGGQQPLYSTDRRVQAVVNGEIYNFQEVRGELEAKGFVFRTNSDCEVVVHGYVAWGEAILERIQGMFALAIWDERERRLLLARDRMGKKPLYYAFVGPARQTLIFGSELKVLLQHPEMERHVGARELATYLTYECLPESTTILKDARKLLPGSYLIFDRERGQTSTGSYWRMRFADSPVAAELSGMSEAQLVERLRTLIRASTRARLISDVPLGVLLSGGIDSSMVAAAMAEEVPPDQVETFSITFADASFDEGTHARRVADHLGTHHHEQRLSPEKMLNILPEVADIMCEPLGDASIIPTYLLSRFTRQTVTVALGGDGGDELFLGYPTFQAQEVANRLDRMFSPRTMATVGKALTYAARKVLPVSRKNFSFDFKVKRFAQGLGYAPDLRHQAWMGSFLPEELRRVLSDDLREVAHDPYALIAGFRERPGMRDHYDQQVYQYARMYLTGDVLVKVDRASMAHALEVRAPLLDTRIVDFANALPGELKLNNMTTKYLLKRAAEKWLPEEIITRPKKGFGVPIGAWLRGPLEGLARDMLASHKLRREGFFDPKQVARLLEEHKEGVADHHKPLWTLLAFELWLERFGTRAAVAESDDDSTVMRAVG